VKKALSNPESDVEKLSAEALSACPHPRGDGKIVHAVWDWTGNCVGWCWRPRIQKRTRLSTRMWRMRFRDWTAEFTMEFALMFMERLREKAARLKMKPQDVAQALWVGAPLGL